MTFCAHCGASVSSGTPCSSCGAATSPAPQVANEAQVPNAGMKRPLGVSILGWLWLVMGAVTGIFLMLGGALIATAFSAAVPGLPLDAKAVLGLVLVLAAAFAAFLIWLGIALLRGRRWAHVTSIVLAVLGILGALEEMAGGAFGSVLDLLVGTLIVCYLLRPTTRAWFARAAPSAPGVPVG